MVSKTVGILATQYKDIILNLVITFCYTHIVHLQTDEVIYPLGPLDAAVLSLRLHQDSNVQ